VSYQAFYQESISDPSAFWEKEASLVDWHKPFDQVHDGSRSPFEQWFVGGKINLCHNAVDRHLATRPDQTAVVWVSTEVDQEETYTYRELHTEVQAMAAILQNMGVKKGDRVLIYMPMIPQAAFAMLACLRLGAIHTVVFGGFASGSLATRIDDSAPKVIISADAGSRGGRHIPYKPLVDAAIEQATHQPDKVLLVDRGLVDMDLMTDRDVIYGPEREKHLDTAVECEWVDASHPSYILYTSGTTGTPKGVQRDTGGYTVALASSMQRIYLAKPGDTMFTTSDIGWVVGHSYIVYGPLIGGVTTIMYEGLPTRPDPAIWWRLVERFKVNSMFSAPTAIRLLKKEAPDAARKFDLGSLHAFFLAGEPLDETTAAWAQEALGVPVIDNYWQTESGWPILTLPTGVGPIPSRLGSAGLAVYGYNIKLFDEETGAEVTEPGQKGVVTIASPLPPGFMQTVWQDDQRFIDTYWSSIPNTSVYNTSDWGIRDADGYYTILGRTDDVINVAGHRLGTREIEASLATHSNIAEAAVVGVADSVRGQTPVAFVTLRDGNTQTELLQQELQSLIARQLGAVARPSAIYPVNALPKTRSGKVLRRALQAVAEGRETGDMSTLEDPAAIEEIKGLF